MWLLHSDQTANWRTGHRPDWPAEQVTTQYGRDGIGTQTLRHYGDRSLHSMGEAQKRSPPQPALRSSACLRLWLANTVSKLLWGKGVSSMLH